MADTDDKIYPKYDAALKHVLDLINSSRSSEGVHHLAEAYSLLRQNPVSENR